MVTTFDPRKMRSAMDPSMRAASCSQGQEIQGATSSVKTTPLQLLDLPMDILQAIMRDVTHTNDLTALALTHSTLHALVIPHIYSRFDIVWPDAGPTLESRAGVDALTYGLATLVMAQDVFGEGPRRASIVTCTRCKSSNFCQHRPASSRARRTRRGNNFAQYTRKFSLGNGPEDWVKEYLITKEGGKMLGTLVALAVGRMHNLESFTWDMPTGVLRDVWLALASLDGRDDGHECRLERVWVRWHDNQDAQGSSPVMGALTSHRNTPHLLSDSTASFQIPPYPRVEFPTFSVLPPLKSLNVLDIDELSYVEEMSVLIEASHSKMQELRVGLARHAQNRPWARPREDRTVVPPLMQAGEETPRPGGILGILLGRLCSELDISESLPSSSGESTGDGNLMQAQMAPYKDSGDGKVSFSQTGSNETDVNQLSVLLSVQDLGNEPEQISGDSVGIFHQSGPVVYARGLPSTGASQNVSDRAEHDLNKLRLETLELERVHLSTHVLCQALDWSRLRTLTILGCRDHEQLWKVLRRRFAPPSHHRSSSGFKLSTASRALPDCHSPATNCLSSSHTEYSLHITRLHTDAVSPSLLAFLKDALGPDTVEYLFLQQSPMYKSSVTIDQIYKHVIRRHRGSLVKLLIDSEIRTIDGSPGGNTNWRKWAASRELITCITSGRMCLRELSIGLDYKDWHYFLQRLPNAPKLRSLHISHIADYVHSRIDAREAALQIVDIVALRPELELCYLGIQGKCFEVLEHPDSQKFVTGARETVDIVPSAHLDDDDDISDGHEDFEQETNDNNHDDDADLITDQEDLDEMEDEARQAKERIALRLREILFYDDKVSIFKARHGKL